MEGELVQSAAVGLVFVTALNPARLCSLGGPWESGGVLAKEVGLEEACRVVQMGRKSPPLGEGTVAPDLAASVEERDPGVTMSSSSSVKGPFSGQIR